MLIAVMRDARGTHDLRAPHHVADGDMMSELPEGDDSPDFWATAPYADTPRGRAAELIDAGAGRRRLAKEIGVSEYEARRLLAEQRNGATA
jgi:hypothetical protein